MSDFATFLKSLPPKSRQIYAGRPQAFKDAQDLKIPTYRTNRFWFRPYKRSDFFAWHYYVQRGYDIDRVPYGILRQINAGYLLGEASDRDMFWSIEFLSTGGGVGDLSVMWNKRFEAFEIWLFLCADYRGKNYGIEIAKGIKDLLFSLPGIDEVVLIVSKENKRALRLVHNVLSSITQETPKEDGDYLIWQVDKSSQVAG